MSDLANQEQVYQGLKFVSFVQLIRTVMMVKVALHVLLVEDVYGT